MHQQQKHENQMREMIGQCESNIRELQQLQVNKGQHFSVLHVVVDLLVCVTTLSKSIALNMHVLRFRMKNVTCLLRTRLRS